MKLATYRGVRLKVKKGRTWGYLTWIVNGEPWGDWLGRDEDAAIELMKRYVDNAAARPGSSPIFEPREAAS